MHTVGKPGCTQAYSFNNVAIAMSQFTASRIGSVYYRKIDFWESFNGKRNVIFIPNICTKNIYLAYDGKHLYCAEGEGVKWRYAPEYLDYYKQLCSEFSRVYPDNKFPFSEADLPVLKTDFDLLAIESHRVGDKICDLLDARPEGNVKIQINKSIFSGSSFIPFDPGLWTEMINKGYKVLKDDSVKKYDFDVRYFSLVQDGEVVVGRIEATNPQSALLFKILGDDYFIAYVDNLRISKEGIFNLFWEPCGKIHDLGTGIVFDEWLPSSLTELGVDFPALGTVDDPAMRIAPCNNPSGISHSSLWKVMNN